MYLTNGQSIFIRNIWDIFDFNRFKYKYVMPRLKANE